MDTELKEYLDEKFGALLRQIAEAGNAGSSDRPDTMEGTVEATLKRLERRLDHLEQRIAALDGRATRGDDRITREGVRVDRLIAQLERRIATLQNELDQRAGDDSDWGTLDAQLLRPVD